MLRATYAGFTTALSALQANQKRLDVTGHNLANMTTEGYTRQELSVTSLNYDHPSSFYMNENDVNVGFGVSIDGVRQARDPFLDTQFRMQNAIKNYNQITREALSSLEGFLDESHINGLHAAFNNVQTALTTMQDPSKVNDPVYEGQLRSRMKEVTVLLNEASIRIDAAVKNEYQRLDGTESNKQGAEQKVNELLKDIGNMNCIIKRSQILGDPSLELTDQRNALIDKLSEFLPIEVSYYKDPEHEGEKAWPDDLKIELVYENADSALNRLTLVDGTKGGNVGNTGKNCGSIKIDADGKTNRIPESGGINYQKVFDTKLVVTEAGDKPESARSIICGSKISDGSNTTENEETVRLSGGSIQAGIDMLSRDRYGTIRNFYEYKENLDNLARTFAKTMNEINRVGTRYTTDVDDDNLKKHIENRPYALFEGRNLEGKFDEFTGTEKLTEENEKLYNEITAGNIVISEGWKSDKVHIGTRGESSTDSVLNMLNAMEEPQKGLENMRFVSYANFLSTQLASDASVTDYKLETDTNIMNAIQRSKDEISGISLDEEAAHMLEYTSAYNAAARLMTALDEVLNTLINGTGIVGR